MITPVDEQFAKKLALDFDIHTVRGYNDYAFDLSNDMSLVTQICFAAYNEPEKFALLKTFLENYRPARDSDQYLASLGYCRYAEREFEEGIKHISALLEFNPSNIDVWIDLCFFMAHIPDGYDAYLNMRFHLYHFIHTYLKYDFHSVNKKAITVLNRLVHDISHTPSICSGYEKKVEFDTEYLIVNGACNNRCTVCHIPDHLRDYDFGQRLSQIGFLTTAKYLFVKVRKKCIKHFVLKGGEPTLHPEYLKIVKTIAGVRPDVLIHVRTNARAFCNVELLEAHARAQISNIVFETNIFSHDPHVHDGITRAPMSHEQTVRGMRNMLDQGFKTSARIPLCDENIEELPLTLDFLLKEFSGDQGFGQIEILLPAPSAENLNTYYPDGVRRLRDRAADVIGAYPSGNRRISISNQALAEHC